MSIDVQKQIKENSTDISNLRLDLSRWIDDQEKQETRRDRRRRGDASLPSATTAPAAKKAWDPNENEACAVAAMDAMASAAGIKVKRGEEDETEKAEPIRRDKQAMHQYYTNWDQFDAEEEVEKLDEVSFQQQQQEREVRQAEKDRILDELALKPDGDRSRTSRARPRVKISVRTSGRRVAPVDLAQPKRKEANGYFTEGRFREAVATYSSALDLLEKYEPPGASSSTSGAGDAESNNNNGNDGDESEALQLKTTLLANRAAALLKLEEWRHVVDDCTEALQFDPQHGKATLRRGFAYARQKIWAKAARDLELAVAWDPGDRKASAELQMARRMLQEQAKEARDRARRVMLDPTRQPTMPTRRLTVRVQRSGSSSYGVAAASSAAPSAAPAAAQSASVLNDLDGLDGLSTGALPSSAPAPAPAAASAAAGPPAERRPYVPRSVRMRGRQPGATQAAVEAISSAGSGDAPSAARGSAEKPAPQMNFYAFETLWVRHRSRPAERLALLRRVGARALPALFRESLDSELVASISEVLSSELAGGAAGSTVPAFAVDVLEALARTPRFDVSCRGLTRDERRVCRSLLDSLAESAAGSREQLTELRSAYEEPVVAAPPAAGDGEDSDEALADAEASAPPPSAEPTEPAAAQVQPAAAFDLDGCD